MKSLPVFCIIIFFPVTSLLLKRKMTIDSLLFALNVLLTVTKSILDGKNRRLINALWIWISLKNKIITLVIAKNNYKNGIKIQTFWSFFFFFFNCPRIRVLFVLFSTLCLKFQRENYYLFLFNTLCFLLNMSNCKTTVRCSAWGRESLPISCKDRVYNSLHDNFHQRHLYCFEAWKNY